MATSGSVDYTVTRDDIIQDALENLGIVQPGATPIAAHVTMAARKLNLIVKQWMGTADFAPGLKMWSRKRAYLFLSSGSAEHTLGPTTTETGKSNKWANSYAQTTLSADASNGASSVTITTTTGFASGYRIGIVLNTGALFWTTISGSLTGNSVPLTSVTVGAAAAGNVVFCYATTEQARRPLTILTAVRRDSDGNDTPIYPMSLEEYEALPVKTTETTPTRYYYEAALTNGNLFLDAESVDCSNVIRMVYLSPIEDFDASTNDADYPQEWFRALCWQLTIELAPGYGTQVTQEMKLLRDESLSIARNTNPETSEVYFQPNA